MKESIIILLIFLFNISLGYSLPIDTIKNKKDTTLKSSGKYSKDTSVTKINPVQIDTNRIINQIDTSIKDNIQRLDSIIVNQEKSNNMTNTKLFVYIFLSLAGLILFFFVFVQSLFKTFHKKKSTRQSMMLSWSLFLIVSIIWLFIIWGIIAGFWNSAALMVVLIFLLIVGLIMTIISLKSN